MSNTKTKSLAELKEALKALKVLQDENPNILNYLSTDLKQSIKDSSNLIKESGTSSSSNLAEMKAKPKGNCAKLKANWETYIANPVQQKAKEISDKFKNDKDSSKKVATAINEYADALFNSVKKEKWFIKFAGKDADRIKYIHAYKNIAERELTLQRNIDYFEDDGTPVEVKSEISGILDFSKGKKETKNVGISDVVKIALPKPIQSTDTIIGGQFNYTLDSRSEPDTFIVKSGGKVIEKREKNIGSYDNSVFFDKVSGVLEIEVIESVDLSVWEAVIILDFVTLFLNTPKCQDDTPCPEFSKGSKKKKTGKTPCPKF
jgi:hypothetical protein